MMNNRKMNEMAEEALVALGVERDIRSKYLLSFESVKSAEVYDQVRHLRGLLDIAVELQYEETFEGRELGGYKPEDYRKTFILFGGECFGYCSAITKELAKDFLEDSPFLYQALNLCSKDIDAKTIRAERLISTQNLDDEYNVLFSIRGSLRRPILTLEGLDEFLEPGYHYKLERSGSVTVNLDRIYRGSRRYLLKSIFEPIIQRLIAG